MPARPTLASAGRACALAAALSALPFAPLGCTTVEVAPEPPPVIDLRLAHLPGFALSMDDEESIVRLEDAVGPLTMETDLGVALFGGGAIANRDAESAVVEIEALGSTAGILVAKSYLVAGERELAGALEAPEALRRFEGAGLLPVRAATYSVQLSRAARLLVLAPGARVAFVERVLAETPEPCVLVAAEAAPAAAIRAALAASPRVKLVLLGAPAPAASPGAGANAGADGPIYLSTRPGRVRYVSIEGQSLRTWVREPGSTATDDDEALRLR